MQVVHRYGENDKLLDVVEYLGNFQTLVSISINYTDIGQPSSMSPTFLPFIGHGIFYGALSLTDPLICIHITGTFLLLFALPFGFVARNVHWIVFSAAFFSFC